MIAQLKRELAEFLEAVRLRAPDMAKAIRAEIHAEGMANLLEAQVTPRPRYAGFAGAFAIGATLDAEDDE